MSGSNAAIYANGGANVTQPVNPLEAQQQMTQRTAALYQLRNVGVQYAGRQALGAAYANAPINPQTGLPATRAVIAALQQGGPAAGINIPDVAATDQARKNSAKS